jgi:hypothetical protein
VSVRTWGFNSPLAHHVTAGHSRCSHSEIGPLLPNFYRTIRV